MDICSHQMVKRIDVSYLDTAVNLVAESFVPNGVFAVPDGPGPNLLRGGSRQPQRHIAV